MASGDGFCEINFEMLPVLLLSDPLTFAVFRFILYRRPFHHSLLCELLCSLGPEAVKCSSKFSIKECPALAMFTFWRRPQERKELVPRVEFRLTLKRRQTFCSRGPFQGALISGLISLYIIHSLRNKYWALNVGLTLLMTKQMKTPVFTKLTF